MVIDTKKSENNHLVRFLSLQEGMTYSIAKNMPPRTTSNISTADLSLVLEETSISADSARSTVSNRFSPKKRRICIRLDRNEVFPIPHIDDLDEEEICDIWYQKQDYNRMKQVLIPVIKKIMKGETVVESNEETARGLEFRTRDGALARQRNKVTASRAVLSEQERQIDNGELDDERLRDVYKSNADHCLEAARQLGVQDEDELKRLLKEDEKRIKKLRRNRSGEGIRKLIRKANPRGITTEV